MDNQFGTHTLGQDAFGLLYHDAAGQRGLELLVEYLGASDRTFLQDRGGGHVGQRLPHG